MMGHFRCDAEDDQDEKEQRFSNREQHGQSRDVMMEELDQDGVLLSECRATRRIWVTSRVDTWVAALKSLRGSELHKARNR
jgi:hypothetical protein